jgi:hypothetical protein
MDHRPSATICVPGTKTNWYFRLPAHVSGRTYIYGILRTVVDVVQVLVDKLHPLVESRLIIPIQVGQVDLKPSQTTLAQWLGFTK